MTVISKAPIDISKRPMLAYTGTDEIYKEMLLRGPLYVSPKLDGIRCRVIDNRATTGREGKRLKNLHIRKLLENPLLEGFDGELVAMNAFGDYATFQETDSAVMSEGGCPNFQYCVFDICSLKWANMSYLSRQTVLKQYVKAAQAAGHTYLTFWGSEYIYSWGGLEEYERMALQSKYEGLIIRSPDGRYKYGRSTVKEGIMGKLKRFEDREAYVTGVFPLEHNENTPTQNDLGYQKRSAHKANQRISDTMAGGVYCTDLHNPEWDFKIGSGFDFAMRERIWKMRNRLVEMKAVLTYKYQPFGVKEKPRSPVFKAFRDAWS